MSHSPYSTPQPYPPQSYPPQPYPPQSYPPRADRPVTLAASPQVRVPRRGYGIVNIASVGCVGLMAGIFWGFAVSVMPGLARLDDAGFVAAMQHINAAIENTAFGLIFVGGLVFPAIAVVLELRAGRRRGAVLAAAGLGCYVLTLAITMGINIPLNVALAAAPATEAAAAAARTAFEGPWTVAHLVRTVTCTLGMVLLTKVACGHAAGRDR